MELDELLKRIEKFLKSQPDIDWVQNPGKQTSGDYRFEDSGLIIKSGEQKHYILFRNVVKTTI